MARKRLILDPPPAISSSEEEETDEEEEEEQHPTVKTQQNGTGKKQDNVEDGSKEEEEEDDDDEEEEEEEEEDEEVGKEKPDLPAKPSKPNSDDDSADTESDQPPSPSLSDFIIKPISPKRKSCPNPEQPKKEEDAEDKKAKRGAGPRTGGSQRIWSDEDEIVILNAMIEYQNEKGKSPFVDTSDFYGFVKESLHFNASTNQFSDKVRRLKKKYYTDVEKNEGGNNEIFSKPHDLECVELAKKIWGAGGIDAGISSKNVISGGGGGAGDGSSGWGGVILALAKIGSGEVNRKRKEVSVRKGKRGSSEEVNGEGKEGNAKRQKRGLNEEADGGEENVKRGEKGWSEEVNGEGKGRGGKQEKVKMLLSEKVNGEGNGKGGKMEKQAENEELNGGEDLSVKKQKRMVNEEMNGEEEGSEDLWEKHPFLCSSLQAENLPEDVKERAMVMLGKVREEKLVELEREWRSLMKAKLEFFMKEKDLIAKQVKLALDALKSQD